MGSGVLERGKRITGRGALEDIYFPKEMAWLESFMPRRSWFKGNWCGEGQEGMTFLGEQSSVKEGLDKVWGLRDHGMFPEMDGANCGR